MTREGQGYPCNQCDMMMMMMMMMTPHMDQIKGSVLIGVRVRHETPAEGHIGRNVMKTLIQRIIKLYFRNLD